LRHSKSCLSSPKCQPVHFRKEVDRYLNEYSLAEEVEEKTPIWTENPLNPEELRPLQTETPMCDMRRSRSFVCCHTEPSGPSYRVD